jgi:hypothetical protein
MGFWRGAKSTQYMHGAHHASHYPVYTHLVSATTRGQAGVDGQKSLFFLSSLSVFHFAAPPNVALSMPNAASNSSSYTNFQRSLSSPSFCASNHALSWICRRKARHTREMPDKRCVTSTTISGMQVGTHDCNIIEAPWRVNGGHGASLRHHKPTQAGRCTRAASGQPAGQPAGRCAAHAPRTWASEKPLSAVVFTPAAAPPPPLPPLPPFMPCHRGVSIHRRVFPGGQRRSCFSSFFLSVCLFL